MTRFLPTSPLEDAGLVARERDPDDARRTVVSATTAGIEAIEAAEARADDALRSAVANLSNEERGLLRRAVPIIAALAADLARGGL